MKKTIINKFYRVNVTANSSQIDKTVVIDNNVKILLRLFGGCAPAIGDNIDSTILLQWGDDTNGWEDIKIGCARFEYPCKVEFTGDGVKCFKITRKNNSNTTLEISAWIDVLFHDQ